MKISLNILFKVFFTIAIIFIGVKFSYGFTFERNLSIGMSGEDVITLQKILNSDPATKITSEGAGSPGMETNYFGPATLDAVKRFQTKYYKEVLFPASLSEATGFVGTLTRTKLESLSVSVSLSVSPSQDPLQSLITPELDFLSSISGKPGDIVVIFGKNFKSINPDQLSVLFSSNNLSYFVWDLTIIDNETLTFTVPSDIDLGIYHVYVTNNGDQSMNSATFTVLSTNVN
ncbi:MAG: IPT/TIG domain-containing protein [Candidatus Paceibacterota bacterium]